jgi:hypothetical protein
MRGRNRYWGSKERTTKRGGRRSESTVKTTMRRSETPNGDIFKKIPPSFVKKRENIIWKIRKKLRRNLGKSGEESGGTGYRIPKMLESFWIPWPRNSS